MPRINYDDYSVFAKALAETSVPKILEKAEVPDISHEFSEEFERKMNVLIKKEKKFYFPIIRTTARKAIIISAAVIVMLSLMCVSVSALRNTVSEFVSRIFIDKPEETSEPVTETSSHETVHTSSASEISSNTEAADIITETETDIATLLTEYCETTAPVLPLPTEEAAEETLLSVPDDIIYPVNFKSIQLEYSENPYYYNFGEISDDKLGSILEEGIITGSDCNTGSDGTHISQAQGRVYSIAGVSEKFAVAVRFSNTDSNKIYRDISYVPETLGNLVDDFGLKTGISCEKIYHQSYTGRHMGKQEITEKIYDVDNDFIFNVLLSDTDAEHVNHYSVTLTDYKAVIDFSALGQIKELLIGVNQAGYIWIDMSGSVFNYYIGEKRANEIIDNLNKNYTYSILVYDEN